MLSDPLGAILLVLLKLLILPLLLTLLLNADSKAGGTYPRWLMRAWDLSASGTVLLLCLLFWGGFAWIVVQLAGL